MFVNATPFVFLLISPHDPAVLSTGSCLSDSYYGQYGQQSVFIVDDACLATSNNLLSSGFVVPLHDVHGQSLMWLEREAIDDSLKPLTLIDEMAIFLSELANAGHSAEETDQQVLRQILPVATPLHLSINTALVAVSDDLVHTLDIRLPRFWKLTPLPESPISFIPVPPSAIDRVKELVASVKFDPVVASIVGNISIPQLQKDIRYLTGEAGLSSLVSRHSFSQGALDAADWLKKQFESTGASCELKPFLAGFAPNVVCTYAATKDTNETVLLSAHYDSRGSFGSIRAPGGDDDGSGTVALLSIARTIARKGITFRKNIQLCAFAGEEQGLLGSKAYAREMREANADLTLMIQADMLAYHAPGEPSQLGLPDLIGTPEVAELVTNLAGIYSPELVVGYTPACCSDHQSFHDQGFPGTQVFERAGPIADPMYHNSGDLSERPGYDFEQLRSIAKVQFATLLHAAGYDLLE